MVCSYKSVKLVDKKKQKQARPEHHLLLSLTLKLKMIIIDRNVLSHNRKEQKIEKKIDKQIHLIVQIIASQLNYMLALK